MLRHQVPAGSRVSGKRAVALCLLSVTLALLGIPDEADLQPLMVVGLESFSDGADDVDNGDRNGQHMAVAAVFDALNGDRMFAQTRARTPDAEYDECPAA